MPATLKQKPGASKKEVAAQPAPEKIGPDSYRSGDRVPDKGA
jgi:hypothetical protein